MDEVFNFLHTKELVSAPTVPLRRKRTAEEIRAAAHFTCLHYLNIKYYLGHKTTILSDTITVEISKFQRMSH